MLHWKCLFCQFRYKLKLKKKIIYWYTSKVFWSNTKCLIDLPLVNNCFTSCRFVLHAFKVFFLWPYILYVFPDVILWPYILSSLVFPDVILWPCILKLSLPDVILWPYILWSLVFSDVVSMTVYIVKLSLDS